MARRYAKPKGRKARRKRLSYFNYINGIPHRKPLKRRIKNWLRGMKVVGRFIKIYYEVKEGGYQSSILRGSGRGANIKDKTKYMLDAECYLCGSKEELTIDHKLPVCLNGNNHHLNLRTLCRKHHKEKSKMENRYRKFYLIIVVWFLARLERREKEILKKNRRKIKGK